MSGPSLTPSDLDQISDAVQTALAPMIDSLVTALEGVPTASPPAAPARVAMSRTPAPAPSPVSADVFEMAAATAAAERVRAQRELASLEDQVAFYEALLLHSQAEAVRLQYELDFNRMERDGIRFDREDELTVLMDLPDDLRPAHLERIRTQYKRTSIGQTDRIPTAYPEQPDAPLTDEDRKAIIEYASTNRITSYDEARTKYMAERKANPARFR